MAAYFAKFIFESVDVDLDEEIHFDQLREVIKNTDLQESKILQMFSGTDQFADPVQEYTEKKIRKGELRRSYLSWIKLF